MFWTSANNYGKARERAAIVWFMRGFCTCAVLMLVMVELAR